MFQKIESKIEKIGFEKVAVFFILFFGVCLRIITPPYQTPDEINHFGRAWQVSEGIFLGESEKVREVEKGNNPITNRLFQTVTQAEKLKLHSEDEKFLIAEIPSSMIPADFETVNLNLQLAAFFGKEISDAEKISLNSIEKFFSAPLEPEKTEILMIPNTGQYSPLAYFPQAIAAFIGRNLNFSAGVIYYAMCFASLFFSAIRIFFAMKLLPEKKILIFLIASIPMFLVEANSTSADAVTNSVGILISAWFLSQRKNFEAITYKENFLLVIFSICLGILKSVYGTILILYFLIPRQRFKNIFHFVGFGIFLFALNLITSSFWLNTILSLNDVEVFTTYYGSLNTDIAAQKNFVFENPIQFTKIFFASVLNLNLWHADWFFGLFGWPQRLPETFCIIYFAILILSSLIGKLNLNLFQRGTIFFTTFVTFFGIFAAEYLFWTQVGENYIDGVQGRYFIPIALSTFCILPSIHSPKFATLIALLFGIFSTIFIAWLIFTRFFI